MDAYDVLGFLCTLRSKGDSNPDGDTTKDDIGVNFYKADMNCWSHFKFVLFLLLTYLSPYYPVPR